LYFVRLSLEDKIYTSKKYVILSKEIWDVPYSNEIDYVTFLNNKSFIIERSKISIII